MTRIICTILLSVLAISTAQAESQFPGYLSKSYCHQITVDFMINSMNSLQRYRDKQLAERHRGGMNNIRKYILQRQEWLQECDQYLSTAAKSRVFQDELTTEDIFEAMNSLSGELESLIAGVTYSVDAGGDPTDIAAEKFDRLFSLVDKHKTRLLLKGQLVVR